MLDPPPLPARLSRVSTIVATGSLLWSTAAAALLIARLAAGRPLDLWFTTCVAGALVGGFGWSVFRWQRAAGRHGSRTAQRGLE